MNQRAFTRAGSDISTSQEGVFLWRFAPLFLVQR
jgi:hypothetical protein